MADGFSNLTKRMLEDREAQAAEFERQQKVLEDYETLIWGKRRNQRKYSTYR